MLSEKIANQPVATIDRNASLHEAAKAMRDQHVGDLVVVDQTLNPNVPVGMLTDRDIVVSTLALGIDPSVLKVGDIMSDPPAVVEQHASVDSVIRVMKKNGYRRIPVVDRKNELTGIISVDDITAYLAREMDGVATVTRRQLETESERRRSFIA